MRILRLIPEFPLLRRELTELAQRKRTYALRTLGAIVLLAIAMLIFADARSMAMARAGQMSVVAGMPVASYLSQFGMGGQVFERMVPFLFWTVDLLMPAICCAAVTSEKERNTLGNLFLTRISPTMLLFEKLGSRLIPMFILLLLTLPVLAFVYSLGGVDTTLMVATFWLLFWESVLLASIGLMCSCWFPTTVGAFIWSYALVGLLLILTQTTGVWLAMPRDVWMAVQYEPLSRVAGLWGVAAAPVVLLYGLDVGLLLRVVGGTFPAIMVTLVLFMLARLFIVRRAFVSTGSLLLKLFGRLDTFFVKLNEATTRGVEIFPDHNSMPLFDPVAWRERTRKSLGKARYLFRILVVTEGPTLFICVLAAQATSSSAFNGLRVLLAILWAVVAMIVCVKAGTLISSEYSRETVAPLLSTPLTAVEILRQKVVGVRRLLMVLSIPILSVHLALLLLYVDLGGSLRVGGLGIVWRALTYLILVTVSTAVLLLSATWLSALVGMLSRKQTRSILFAVTACGCFVAAPIVLEIFLQILARWSYFESAWPFVVVNALSPTQFVLSIDQWLTASSSLTPAVALGTYGADDMSANLRLLKVIALFAVQFVILLLFRTAALKLVPRILERREQPSKSPVVKSLPTEAQLAPG